MDQCDDNLVMLVTNQVFSCTCEGCRRQILTDKFGPEGAELYFKLVGEGRIDGSKSNFTKGDGASRQ